jgi:CRP-like cAMP-binding protein
MSDFQKVQFQSGELIFKTGDQAEHLFVIETGVVELLDTAGQAFAQIGQGQPFGEQAFLKGGIRGASAKAQGAVSCMRISSDEANDILSNASPILIPIFEALLLQQNMHNALKTPLA